MAFHPIQSGQLGIAWPEQLQRNIRWDPYLVWADVTGFKLLGGNSAALQPADSLPVLLRLLPRGERWGVPQGVDVLPAYSDAPGIASVSHVTATVPVSRIAALAAEVESLQVALPRRIAGTPRRGDCRLLCGRRAVVAPLLARNSPTETDDASGAALERTVIGVIDDGFAFANRRFLNDAGKSRVLRLWQQDVCHVAGMAGWQPAPGWYGRELDRGAINELLHRYRSEPASIYRHIDYLHPTARAYHGTHVLDLAAGWPNPLDLLKLKKGDAAAGVPQPRDPAALADLVLVQLPTLTSLDTSGASLAGFVLDAIHYILQHAEGAKVVVNLSYGAHAGPHDGSSFLESAIKESLPRVNSTRRADDRRPLDVVVPAGNAHESRCHAVGNLAAGESTELHWEILPDDPTDSFLEVWLPRGGELAISVTPPGGRTTEAVCAGSACAEGVDERCRFAVIYPRRCALGGDVTEAMALIAVAPTRLRGAGPTAPHGVWRITLHALCNKLEFDAWIERDDAVFGTHYGGRQSRFLEGKASTAEGTLNSIGTLEMDGFWVVGGMRRSDWELARYSGAGTNRGRLKRLEGPDRVTWCEESRTLRGLPGAGSLGRSVVRMNGTSVAAPLLARELVKGEPALPPVPRGGNIVPEPPNLKRQKAVNAALRGESRRFRI